MTIDPFKNHFKCNRLVKISESVLNHHGEDDEGFKSLLFVEGSVIEKKNHEIFTELLVKDDSTGLIVPVICFEDLEFSGRLLCVGTIHYNWTPDLRLKAVSYSVALKVSTIKIK